MTPVQLMKCVSIRLVIIRAVAPLDTEGRQGVVKVTVKAFFVVVVVVFFLCVCVIFFALNYFYSLAIAPIFFKLRVHVIWCRVGDGQFGRG